MLKTSAEISDLKQNGGSSVGGRLKLKIDKEYRYSREEMLRISKCELSLQRPAYLSIEFDNENGKFQPDKWLEYRWVVEGIENRPTTNVRRKEKIKPEVLDGNCTVLSPQRRGFSSGCRAASPHKTDSETERLGANKGNWRSGAGFMLKNSTGTNDFKPSFQKNAVGNGEVTFTRGRQSNNADRRAAGDGGFKPSFHKEGQPQGRNRLVNSISGEEKVPEWMEEGPTSMHDMIELKGFDDERRSTKRTSGNKARREAFSKQHTQQKTIIGKSIVANRLEAAVAQSSGDRVKNVIIVDSKSSSRESSCPSPSIDKIEKNAPVSSSEIVNSLTSKVEASLSEKITESPTLPASLINNKLPNSDAEFAAIMGLLDTNDFGPLKENALSSTNDVTSDPAPCSRLSRFFSTTSKAELPSSQQIVAPGDSNNNESSTSIQNEAPASSNSILQKIFASSQSSSPMHLEPSVPASLPGVVRAEDLEKGFQWEAARGIVAPPSTSNGSENLRQLVLSPQPSTTSRHHQLATYLVSKGNPLGDPHQQARLMNKLNKFARQQDLNNAEELASRNASLPGPLLQQHVGVSGLPIGAICEVPRFKPTSQEVALQTAIFRPHMDAAFLKNMQLAANQQHAAAMMHSPQQAEAAVRNMLANLMAKNNVSHAAVSGVNNPVTTSTAQVRSSTTSVPNAFMPTSVMRHMTKNNVSIEDKSRRTSSVASASTYTDDEKHRSVEDALQKQTDYMRNNFTNLNGNNSDIMSKLLQQQYIRAIAMRSGIQPGTWPMPHNLLPQWRAQALAASQAEQQRLYALALMRSNVDQAQALGARIFSQQAATANLLNASGPANSSVHYQHNPQTVVTRQSALYTSGGISHVSDNSAQNVHKYQSPLEKLLQSAGVPTKQPGRTGPQENSQGGHGIPSIISRLPPQANCISVEDLEKQYASN